MVYTYLAIISIITPFLLTFFFKDKKMAFLYIFNFFVLFHLIISLFTQSLGIFNLKLLITVNVLIALVIILFLFKKKPEFKIKKNIWVILFFAIIFFQLFSVHNFYDGTITTINGYQEVENFKYHQPYFSDEWITALLSNYSIETGNLPTKNPMNYGAPIVNLLIPYFSFVSNFFLISNLDPVDNFYIFPLITGMLICIFSFILIRSLGVRLFPALISTIFITYITNGTNLPGIWYLLPYTLGLIMFLNTLIFIRYDNFRFILLSSILSIILYPPIAIFSIPSIIGYLYKKEDNKKVLIYSGGALIFLVILALIIFIIGTGNTNIISLIKQIITEYIFREGVEDGIPSYSIFNIIPTIAALLGLFSYYLLIRKKIYEFLVPITIGLVLWIFYTTTTKVFFIEYPRVVVITSILLIITSTIPLNFLWEKYICSNKDILFKFKEYNFNAELVTKILIIVFIIYSSFSYTENKWDKLILTIDKEKGIQAHPASPANQYLTEEDKNLFRNIKKERFISNDWKGLVIGATTSNIPMNTKSSIIANKYLAYPNFSNGDCNIRRQIVEDLEVDYVYTQKFECINFREIGKSSEELYLYQVIR